MFRLTVDDEIDLYLYVPAHAEALYTLADNNREHIGAHLPWIFSTHSISDVRDYINRARRDLANGGDLQTAVFYNGELAGGAGLMIRNAQAGIGEIGYWLGKKFTGKGIATRAARAFTDFGFAEMGLNRIIIRCAAGNTASCAVAERLGYVYEGTHRQEAWMPDHLQDMNYYAMLADDWKLTHSDRVFSHRIDESLELRLLEERHTELLFSVTHANRKHLQKWLPWVKDVQTIDDTRDFIRRALQQYADHNGWQAGIWYGGSLVGAAGYHHWNFTHQKTMIGYWLSKEQTQKGIMTRVVEAMTDYAIYDIKLNRVEIACATDNTRSCAIPERLGFTHEGVLRDAEQLYDRYVDWNMYAMLAADWRNRDQKKGG